MPEPINLRADSTAARFLAAAVALGNAHHAVKGKLVGTVRLTIDNVEVPFGATLHQMEQEFLAQVDQKALVRAQEMIEGAGLGAALDDLRAATQHVRRVFQLVREKAPDDTQHVERA